MKKIKLFTISAPGDQTLEDGSLTHYEINTFLKTQNIVPKDISAEYNELSGKLLISIGYSEGKSLFRNLYELSRGIEYVVRFATLCQYNEKAHTVFIQKQLEDAINFNTHRTISHGIFVEKGVAMVVFLESK